MKTIKKQVKTIAFVISLLICFQSCKVYHKDSVTLEQAVNENKRAKVVTKNNQAFVFQLIIKENNHFYGLKKKSGEITRTQLYQKDLENIRLQNKSVSTISTVGLSLLIVFGLLGVGGAIFLSGGII